ncbi:hypothetical protein CAPTEDRAFT_221670 [Capitella teleta]|uniref:ceramide glucosyltransferase n=1 Tax=Capitella teleta TaxID=283909 RepID=R7TDN3_CAPTE|nr:hypothetical protein CAPTEDRAFT_221670 [Capitella teleta]|eukprot:ELT91838.1 hypothetical protein CAPTEDRAFT_221670 [Capitella teleta]
MLPSLDCKSAALWPMDAAKCLLCAGEHLGSHLGSHLVAAAAAWAVISPPTTTSEMFAWWLSMDEVTWSYIVGSFAIVPWIFYAFTSYVFISSILYSRCRLHHLSDPYRLIEQLPGVSVIKPLMGVDPLLEENLESHFSLSYPKFELLLCVQDADDPALDVVERLCKKYPCTDCRLFIGGKDGIMNPMVHNMAPGYNAAKYDVIWVSTSRIKANTELLMDMVAKLQSPRVALVHQMPFTTDQVGLAAAVEKVYFGTNVARYYQAFHTMGVSCFTGMSYLLKKSELDTLNGLSWFGKFLAEDFFIAKFLHEKGFRHQVAAVPAQQNVASSSIAAYKDRMVRWMRLRLNMMPFVAGFLEPMNESIPLGIYASWSAWHFFGINPYLWFSCHWLVWFTLDYIQLKGVQNHSLPFGKLTFLVAWLIRESLVIFVYFEAVFGVRYIKWGKRTYRLSNFGESLEISTPSMYSHRFLVIVFEPSTHIISQKILGGDIYNFLNPVASLTVF